MRSSSKSSLRPHLPTHPAPALALALCTPVAVSLFNHPHRADSLVLTTSLRISPHQTRIHPRLRPVFIAASSEQEGATHARRFAKSRQERTCSRSPEPLPAVSPSVVLALPRFLTQPGHTYSQSGYIIGIPTSQRILPFYNDKSPHYSDLLCCPPAHSPPTSLLHLRTPFAHSRNH